MNPKDLLLFHTKEVLLHRGAGHTPAVDGTQFLCHLGRLEEGVRDTYNLLGFSTHDPPLVDV